MKLRVTEELLHALHERTILLQYNSPPPAFSGYGWLRLGDTHVLQAQSLRIESRSGLYGGAYKPLVGGRKSSPGNWRSNCSRRTGGTSTPTSCLTSISRSRRRCARNSHAMRRRCRATSPTPSNSPTSPRPAPPRTMPPSPVK